VSRSLLAPLLRLVEDTLKTRFLKRGGFPNVEAKWTLRDSNVCIQMPFHQSTLEAKGLNTSGVTHLADLFLPLAPLF